MKRIEITDDMRVALEAVARAERAYLPGFDSSSIVEIPKLALADATLAAIRAQQLARIARLPRRTAALAPVVDVTIRPKRRRPA